MRDKTLIETRNKKIISRYNELINKKKKGVQIHTYQYVLQELSEEFFLTPDYIGFLITKNS